jgi:hypothetical protein
MHGPVIFNGSFKADYITKSALSRTFACPLLQLDPRTIILGRRADSIDDRLRPSDKSFMAAFDGSEFDLHTQLHLPRVISLAANQAKVSRSCRAVRISPSHPVQKIERLEP